MDPRQWLDDYEARLGDLKQKSDALQENFAAANGRVTSQDGAVTVTVGPNGGLLGLELGHRACDLGPARLTALILTTARAAQQQAARKVMEAFEPMGLDTEAMRMVMDSMPADPDADETDDEPEPEPEPERPPARPQPVAQPRPAARPARRADDEDDDDNQPW
ncbi:YbaB/EbfC family nucleoid-associated protein [Saccharothrix obliqua]|uniref:YbaB/EbfC family nucleoid-associated protein n=1 Tax=Saccharothrix obliqua TaxID=2861747 RepID=UPI001C5F5F59|nr:YbaB/EbfC family nucleoid-associated protein [Saccharothrix obliqua]MBW4716120.1 YbaB/EbfC family nucleoid-associated protein [Saccharothrix obliqua]